MPDTSEALRSRRLNSGMQPKAERRRQWTPVYPFYARGHLKEGQRIENSLPFDWICPCESHLQANKSCIRCGRSPRDGAEVLDGPQHLIHTRDDKKWRKWVKKVV